MKKVLVTLAVAAFAAVSFAQDATQMKVQLLSQPYAVGAGTSYTSQPLSVAAYKGNCLLSVAAAQSATAGRTNTVTIQHATTSTGSYSTLTNINGTAMVFTITGTNGVSGVVSNLPCGSDRMHAFLRSVTSQNVDTNAVAVYFIAPMKSE